MKPILEIRNLSKKYRISHEKHSYLSLRDSISGLFKRSGNNSEDFYALKDVSFDVMPGDTVGIIGKNGAGKSTLLKIISRITPPSSGTIVGRGRIASLLEVGTGFHPELSGRENIYFNGSILGMKRIEIDRNFDAIVDFSGVEKFIETPLKHYSSGMQLRLAFAVAAFLENEILIIDEVLAVGDTEFQKKCLGKMDEVSKSGRTVLFVSHDMNAITTLTKKSILIHKGTIN
ncbi:MAG: ABC transporter ATP-binding protein, partial [Bacteroidota bacterium]